MPLKPTEYEVLMSDISCHKLEALVDAKIAQGWEPLGGVSANNNWLFQAMIRKGEKLRDPR